LRILVLSHEFPPVGGGGAKVIEDLCRGLTVRGHELQVLTTHLTGSPIIEQKEKLSIRRINCGRQVPYRARFIEMLIFVIKGFFQGMGLIRSWQPDIIHVQFAVPAGALGLALSIFTGVPYFMTVHLGDVPGGAPEKTAGWFRWIYPFTPMIWRKAKRIVAVSEHTRQLALRHYPVNVEVIRNSFDYPYSNPEEVQVGEPPQVIWAGRFVSEKNPIQVVRTLAELRDLDWTCVMIGDGPERSRVEQEIIGCGLQARFNTPGWVDQNTVMDWFAKSDVLFMPSLSEGLPIAGLQGLAMGLAIVATQVGGFVDLVEPLQNGFLVDNAYSDGFMEPLRTLLSDRVKLRTFRQASFQVANRFDIQVMIQSYNDLLGEIAQMN
jgi:glycosyltransferase involved in cell wall biosynthesis